MHKIKILLPIIILSVVTLFVFSCQKENKSVESESIVSYGFDNDDPFGLCEPVEDEDCTKYYYTDIIPTILGCNAIVTYNVQVCPTSSFPIQVEALNIYNVNIQFESGSCEALFDSIAYYVTHGNQARASYLLNLFNGMAANGIEALALDRHLDLEGGATYNCKTSSLVHVKFFASKCYQLCPIGKKQVYCGLGCCKRSTGYCVIDGVIKRSTTSISQSQPCTTVIPECSAILATCQSSACEMLIAVPIEIAAEL